MTNINDNSEFEINNTSFSDESTNSAVQTSGDSYESVRNEGYFNAYAPRHMADSHEAPAEVKQRARGEALTQSGEEKTAHVLGVPIPGPGSPAEYVPMPGDNRTVIAPNGAIIRNPWSEQPEITPDHEYTEEKEDLNLLIM
ncbi:MAG: hypothetical protein IJH07_02580 [Ruminococcus sp.]|nr:hypothetical protein [Ruminococcus sp.]